MNRNGQVGRRRRGSGLPGDRGADPDPLPDEHPGQFPGDLEKPGADLKVRLVSAPGPLTIQGIPEAPEADDALVPDFRGMSIREVLKKSKEKGLEVRISGKRLGDRAKTCGGKPHAGKPPLHRHLQHGVMRGSDASFAPDARHRPAANHGQPDGEVASVCYDSRRCGAGSLFVAIPGLKTDGRAFIADAVAAAPASSSMKENFIRLPGDHYRRP